MANYFPMLLVAAMIAGAALLVALLPNIVALLPRRHGRSHGHRVLADGESRTPSAGGPRLRFWQRRAR